MDKLKGDKLEMDELKVDEDQNQQIQEVPDEILEQHLDSELRQITQELEELYQLSVDLSTLVDETGEDIDEVESQTSQAEVHVETGTKEIQDAVEYTKARRGWMSSAAIMLTSTGVSVLSWIGGPIIGVPSTIAAMSAGGAIVYAKHKRSSDQ